MASWVIFHVGIFHVGIFHLHVGTLEIQNECTKIMVRKETILSKVCVRSSNPRYQWKTFFSGWSLNSLTLKSQTTTWDVWNPTNHGKNYQPQLVSSPDWNAINGGVTDPSLGPNAVAQRVRLFGPVRPARSRSTCLGKITKDWVAEQRRLWRFHTWKT